MDLINSITAVCSLVLAISAMIMGFLHYVVITPLKMAIDRLSETIERLEKAVGDMETQQREMDKRLTIVEQTAKSAHKRLDVLTHKPTEVRE